MPNRKTARSTAKIVDNHLTYREITPLGDFYHTIDIESEEFLRWLERGETFSYNGEYTVRCEKRRNTFYWYAFQKEGKKLLKKYIGVSAAVKRQKLLEVWAAFKYGEDHPMYKIMIPHAGK